MKTDVPDNDDNEFESEKEHLRARAALGALEKLKRVLSKVADLPAEVNAELKGYPVPTVGSVYDTRTIDPALLTFEHLLPFAKSVGYRN